MAVTGYTIYKYKDSENGNVYYFPVYLVNNTGSSINIYENLNTYLKNNGLPWGLGFSIVAVGSFTELLNYTLKINGDLNIEGVKSGNYVSYTYTIDNVSGSFTASPSEGASLLIPPIAYNADTDTYYTSATLVNVYSTEPKSGQRIYNNHINIVDTPTDNTIGNGTNTGWIDENIKYYGYQFGSIQLFSTQQDFIKALLGKSKKYDGDDPNGNSGDSEGSGGNPPDDIGGNPHKKGETPSISALDSGLITLYNPTVEELQALGQFLWSDSFDINSFKKLFNDPFDTLLGLSLVPIKPTVSGTHNIMFGNLDSGVSSSVVAKQWVSVDCGTLTLNETWNGALDYAPSTQVSIYLPFIGVRQLNVNDVMGSVLHLYYNFDVLTGTCIAEITINHSGQGNKESGWGYNADMGSVYTFEGQCAVNIPLASQDFTNTIRAAIGAVGMVAGAAASCATGNPALGIASLMMGTAQAGMTASTPTVERSGHLSSSSALMASLEPCLFIQRPHICKPERYYALRGVPSQVYVSNISSCTGFFQLADIHNIHVSGATDSELDMIKDALTSGVFVEKWATETVDKQDTLKITLYNNKSAKNKIDKEISAVRDDNILDGTFRDSCDIENPVIRLKINDVSSLNNLNYMYIGIFQRYYYITKIVSMRNHIIEITGHVDVLMTYGKEIGQNTGIIARSSQVPAYGNTYLDDNELATYSDTYNVSYPWGYSFEHSNDSLLLAVAGASVSSST